MRALFYLMMRLMMRKLYGLLQCLTIGTHDLQAGRSALLPQSRFAGCPASGLENEAERDRPCSTVQMVQHCNKRCITTFLISQLIQVAIHSALQLEQPETWFS